MVDFAEVRVQRLQGHQRGRRRGKGRIIPYPASLTGRAQKFSLLWGKINGEEAANSWISARTFTVNKCNVDELPASKAA